MNIQTIKAREILDSRGNPTIEVDVLLINGVMGRASVPSGASTGQKEAHELRDNDAKRYLGKGVLQACQAIHQHFAPALCGFSVANQADIDAKLCELDGSEHKSTLGANAILAVSLACARAYSASCNQPLFMTLQNSTTPMRMPVPMMNIINGGAHANNTLAIQEFMIMPVGAPTFSSALQMGAEVFHHLKRLLKQQNLSTAVGDEGGFAPNFVDAYEALDNICQAIEHAGFKLGHDVVFALDVAASEIFDSQKGYQITPHHWLNSEQLITYYQKLIKDYPIMSIEDGLDEQDWQGWQRLTQQLGQTTQLVGDDLFVTNAHLLQEGINQGVANAILIKLNQIGTLTETQNAIRLAKAHHYNCIISHRSGETEDTFIADLAVATGCGQIKTGGLCRSDRVAKYNQLLRIEELTALPYAGRQILSEKRQTSCA
ncbi:MAG: phosphopyruvate hydratase [Legionellaceae bacterium]|nr:phosphopyruvate hydratase [Legionellaceae bacterium]HCA90279.1 phosphopyruvate hydratase [Legionellales bacterium]|tara:strand:+ start:4122 stop:5414 length:1293 start_codon:yes stop_codon:yes gene_type:complete